jgi:hypothetical protein
MKHIGRIVISVTTALAPSFALAGTSAITAVIGPVGGGSNAVTAAVPTMSNGLMVVLGVVLAVVAWRFLKNSSALQKVVSAVLLGGGLLVGGAGIESTQATGTFIYDDNSICEGATTEPFQFINERPDENSFGSGASIKNGCLETSLEVLEYQSSCDDGREFFIPAGSEKGVVIAPGSGITWPFCGSTG